MYDTAGNDNEEQSAGLASKRLAQLNFPAAGIALCHRAIMATKTHDTSNEPDINLFTDADLSILGAPWRIYETYALNICKEYSRYPDEVYRPGRAQVLRKLLSMPELYKTKTFASRYEKQARENMEREIKML